MEHKVAKTSSVGTAPVDVPLIELDEDSIVFDMSRRDAPKILADKYLMGKVIGAGMSAQVIEILDLQTLQRKVVKVFDINRQLKLGETLQEKMSVITTEYRILRRLDHQNVIKVFELVRQEDQFRIRMAVVTEYCAGNLEELCNSRPEKRLPLSNCHFYFHQLIDGVEYLHSKSIAHGDIKPPNLMIVNDNTLKIADFGSCWDLGIFPGNEKTGFTGSSAFFQPPESLRERPENEPKPDWTTTVKLLFTADIWCCGIVLFMTTCGRHPFLVSDHGTTHELHDAIIKDWFVVTPIIQNNRALDLLFRKIFEPDWKKRAGIREIKRDVWYNISVSHTDTAGFPARIYGEEGPVSDKYRSMTMTQALNQLVRPINEKVKILGKDMPDFDHRKEIPYLRANRSPEPARSPPKSLFQSLRDRAARFGRRF
jgi:serine/threonine-protein kinase 11